MNPSDLAELDATAQAALVSSGECSPSQLVEAAIERIEEIDPQLNAVVTKLYDRARQQAASEALPPGHFRGVPLLLIPVATTGQHCRRQQPATPKSCRHRKLP